jgi:hypothetical protein
LDQTGERLNGRIDDARSALSPFNVATNFLTWASRVGRCGILMERLRFEKASMKCRGDLSIQNVMSSRTIVGQGLGPSHVCVDISEVIYRCPPEPIVATCRHS